MKWRGRQGSSNVDDRRGRSGGMFGGGGSGFSFGGGGGKKLGLGGLVIVIIIFLAGGNPLSLLTGGDSSPTMTQQPTQNAKGTDDELSSFVSVVLKDTEDIWNKLFREQLDRSYSEPTLVLFTDQVRSGCGGATKSTGPFYCPADQKVYIDLSFYRDLRDKFNAPGDFAMAYVIAHEVGHHVQHLTGQTDKVHTQRGRVSQEEYNQLSVRLELQADFLAGIWAHYAQSTKDVLEEGDIEEAMNAAEAIGDDQLQRQSTGRVRPESFTHGTSAQRKRWFMKGFNTGDLSQGDTFGVPYTSL